MTVRSGNGRLGKLHGLNEAGFALLVSDGWQKPGSGRELLKRLVQVARDEKLARVIGHILPENRAMQNVCRKVGFGFELRHSVQAGEWKAVINL